MLSLPRDLIFSSPHTLDHSLVVGAGYLVRGNLVRGSYLEERDADAFEVQCY